MDLANSEKFGVRASSNATHSADSVFLDTFACEFTLNGDTEVALGMQLSGVSRKHHLTRLVV